MVRLAFDRFFNELGSLYQQHKNQGSVWVTMKHVEFNKKTNNKTSGCLIRATDGKTKISCLITSTEQEEFQKKLNILMRSNMDGLERTKKVRRKGAIDKTA